MDTRNLTITSAFNFYVSTWKQDEPIKKVNALKELAVSKRFLSKVGPSPTDRRDQNVEEKNKQKKLELQDFITKCSVHFIFNLESSLRQ